MIWLAGVAILIASGTAWFLARPLARVHVTDDRERRFQLSQVRDRLLVQLNELDVEEKDRNIDPAVLDSERERLEAELAEVLRELEEPKAKKSRKKAKQESRRGWIVALSVFGVALPLGAGGLYALNQRNVLGMLANAPSATAQQASMPPMVMEMVGRLEKRLASQPDDPEGWARLGRAYAVMGRNEEANAAYARSYKLNPNDPLVVAEYAGFLYNSNPENAGGQVFGLFTQLLKLEPNNRDALWFLGFAAFQKEDRRKALEYWEHLLKTLPADSREAEHLRQIVAKTRAELKKK